MTTDEPRLSRHATPRRWSQTVAWVVVVALSVWCGVLFGRGFADWQQHRDLALARKLANESPVEPAVAAYRRHLERRPGDATARLELALLLRRRDPTGALRELRLIAANSRESLAAARHVAAISVEQERDYDALAPLKLLEAALPDDAGVQQTLAEIYYRAAEYERSLEHAHRARKLKPDNVAVCLLIAEANDDLKRHAEMIEPLEAALRLDNELPQAHLNLAYAYELAGRVDEALPHVEWFVQRFPKSVAGNRLLAKIERGRGRPEAALVASRRASELAPLSLDCAVLEAELLLYLKRPAEAYDRLSPFAHEGTQDRRLVTPLLRAAVLCGKQDEARQLQERLRQLETRD